MPTVSAAHQAKTFKANRVHSRIALSVDMIAGRSRRKHVYEDGALRVRFPNGDDLEAMIVNTAGGMAGGDQLSFEAHVGEGAALTVTTAAAEKVYRSLGDETFVDVRLKVDSGGTLRWLPQETILFDAARLRRTIEIEIAPDAAVVMAEGIIFGRAAMDEQMRQGSLFDRWRVRREGQLVLADTTHLAGDITAQLAQPAAAQGGIAIATVFIAPGSVAQVAAVRGRDYAGEVGISTWNDIALARLVAQNGEALRHDLRQILLAVGGNLPRLWLN